MVVLFEEIGCADKREAYGAYILYSQTLYSSLIAFYRCLFFLSLQMVDRTWTSDFDRS